MKPNERYKIIPTDLVKNLQFRRDLLMKCAQRGSVGRAWQIEIIKVCTDDPLFFFNGFCWVYEPRPRFANGIRLPNMIPFIAWEHQVPAIQIIFENLGLRDIGLEKSRGEGASWIGILMTMHQWLFRPMTAVGLVSKDENSVDDANDPDSLMWKCDFTLKKLPNWMSGVEKKDYKRDVSKHVLRNLRNESTVSGYSAVANVGSGGRKFFFLKDELAKFPRPHDEAAMASTQHVTECRLIVSTPLGNTGAYYEVMHAPAGKNFVKVVLDWKQNPTRNRGLYEWIDGRAVAVDPVNNPLLPEYDPPDQDVLDLISRLRRKGFVIEKHQRSAWYDKECDRAAATPQSIAQELDRDYGGSVHRFFGEAFFDKLNTTATSFVHEGDLDFTPEDIDNIRFDQIEGGPMKIWFPLSSLGKPEAGRYVIGCDISTGGGGSYTSNSTICVKNQQTGAQMLEYASNTISPMQFADLVIAVAKWFYDAYLAWEHNGPGAGFTKQVLNRRYPYIYYRTSQSRRSVTKTKEAGWWTDEKTKEIMFAEFQRAVLYGEFTVKSRDLRHEAGQYVRSNGKIQNALTPNAPDDSKGSSHGDRIIAACVAEQASRDRPMDQTAELLLDNIPEGTMAARQAEWEAQQRIDADGWDDGIFSHTGFSGIQ